MCVLTEKHNDKEREGWSDERSDVPKKKNLMVSEVRELENCGEKWSKKTRG